MSTIGPGTPASVTIDPKANGGVEIDLFVPTYEGGATFNLTAERDNDGDWRVFLPETKDYEVSAGVIYLGAPDVVVNRADATELPDDVRASLSALIDYSMPSEATDYEREGEPTGHVYEHLRRLDFWLNPSVARSNGDPLTDRISALGEGESFTLPYGTRVARNMVGNVYVFRPDVGPTDSYHPPSLNGDMAAATQAAASERAIVKRAAARGEYPYTVLAVYEDNGQPFAASVFAQNPQHACEVAQREADDQNTEALPLSAFQVIAGFVEVIA
jgi:hypothetical protein